MTYARQPAAAPTARQARQFTLKFTAQLTGRSERGPDRKVRRDSFDIDDRRAQVSRRIGDGTTAGALSWIDCLLKTVGEWDNLERRKGGGRPLGLAGMRVLETLLGRHGTVAIDFRSGLLEPALDTIARVAGVCRTTVVRALARLRALKILEWVRRTRRTDAEGQAGPQREQVSNSYYFTPERLPARVLQRLPVPKLVRTRANARGLDGRVGEHGNSSSSREGQERNMPAEEDRKLARREAVLAQDRSHYLSARLQTSQWLLASLLVLNSGAAAVPQRGC